MASPSTEIVTTNERVTGPPAVEMLRLSNLVQQADVEALDLGCGGGIIASKLIERTSNIKRIVAGDIDEQMLAIVTAKRDSEMTRNDSSSHSWSCVEVEKMNQTSIPHPAASFTHVLNNFAIFFLPDDSQALAETYRVLKPSGQAGFTSWKSIAWWTEVAGPALAQHIPEAPKLPNPSDLFAASGWSDVDAVRAKLEKSRFQDVKVSEYRFAPMIEAPPFAQAIAVLIQSIARRVWTDFDFERFGGKIEDAMLSYMQENLENGVWEGKMTAIVAIGTKQ